MTDQLPPTTSPTPDSPAQAGGPATLVDRLGRPLRDLRISVTDRCNFRCRYCMPREVFGADFAFLPRNEILTFEEITRLARLFAANGVRKVRLTGGEPTLRAELPKLIEMLAEIPDLDIAMTTNGSLLTQLAKPLADAGLRRVTVSLDSLDDAVFRAMNDVNFPVAKVLEGLEAADAAGLGPIKVNAVVKRGMNDHTIVDLARFIRDRGYILRYIEYMDVGASNGWRLDDVVPGAEVVEMISREMPLEPAEPNYRGEVAKRWRYVDGSGEVGVITSVTQPFCGDCSRVRLSAEGQLYTCLFAFQGTDFREALRSGATDEELQALLRSVWQVRDDRYSELRSENTQGLRRVEMSYIGG
ncbi:MAG: GTP 3',8-cyclase MoaA [Dehalococcoidia bacterium]|nr:GTP 3',8-cyclase MoaA [Dehalococcoidia bacterium]HRC63252.1 GTP 3',8-cyclase MoaA [Dehalococcoidia bacterium]